MALLTLIACVVTGLAFLDVTPGLVGAVVLGAYLGIELSDARHAHSGRSP